MTGCKTCKKEITNNLNIWDKDNTGIYDFCSIDCWNIWKRQQENRDKYTG
jgi:hypothetical protein